MQYVNYKLEDRVGFITINRPEKKNALSKAMIQELREAFSDAEGDKDARVVILQSRGDTFCSGADLAYLQEMQNYSYEENLADSEHLKNLFYQIYTLKKVVIASVQGNALAGGCGLASVCDVAFAVPHAKFGYTEVKIGFLPALVMVFLIRKIGEGKAKQLLLTGDLINAEQAVNLGIVHKIVSRDDLDTEVYNFARHLADTNSFESMKLTKQMFAHIPSLNLENGLVYAAEMNAKARGNEDCKKGVAAFLNKEKIAW